MDKSKRKKIWFGLAGLTLAGLCALMMIGVIGNDHSSMLQIDNISLPEDIHRFSIDSLQKIPAKVIDSLHTIVRKFYSEGFH